MLIKVISYDGQYHEDFEHWVVRDVTDWEEVDEETHRHLTGWCRLQNQKSSSFRSSRRYIVFCQEAIDIKRSVADYLEAIRAQEEAEAKRKAAVEKRRLTKKAAKAKLEREQEVELLNQLLAKYPNKVR